VALSHGYHQDFTKFTFLKQSIMKSRRQFIKLAGTGMLTAGAGNLFAAENRSSRSDPSPDLFVLGMAGYSFKEFSIEQAIAMMQRIGVKCLSIKDFHMPLNSSREQLQAVVEKLTNQGITPYAVGVIYMNSPEAVEQAFTYAGHAGINLIVGAPDYSMLTLVEQKVRDTGIRIAIHNHGPDNPLFPNATDIWNHIKDLDTGIGICLDIGHTTRDGQDPAADLVRYAERIFDVHIKDVDQASKAGKTVEMGRGVIDIPAVVAALRQINYAGKCSLEFEKDMNDPLAGMAESIGYWKGVCAC
jgi:sugar phosphate isomerase/epimerase